MNAVNTPVKKQRLSEGRKNQDSNICCLQEACSKNKDTDKWKEREQRKIHRANMNQKAAAGTAISHTAGFKTRKNNQG